MIALKILGWPSPEFPLASRTKAGRDPVFVLGMLFLKTEPQQVSPEPARDAAERYISMHTAVI